MINKKFSWSGCLNSGDILRGNLMLNQPYLAEGDLDWQILINFHSLFDKCLSAIDIAIMIRSCTNK